MEIGEAYAGPGSVEEAVALQEELRGRLRVVPLESEPRTVAGLDVAYSEEHDLVAAAVVVLDAATFAVVDQAVSVERPSFPYVPGLFAFREVPSLLSALRALRTEPDVLVCDGHGLAHPRRFGLACHLGLLTGRPSFGVAKTPLLASTLPGDERGASTPLLLDGDEVGRTLRTQTGIRPVHVSPGHLIDLGSSVTLTLALSPHYRLPETTRKADSLSRLTLREALAAS
ncbi:endonuclease V [Actinocorallia sp. A-T 12471]|uniref:endonuclease V n=1 Tax=Actinocorallia sp. A-T 12471 TaxID=3089813 RepID=UPI0029D1AB10|nr:endonuclease V [Actinocorallia sp. A-T 12471]MDX6743354.1 endonuclease V [Actinocorallia sp. A-T 12471]